MTTKTTNASTTRTLLTYAHMLDEAYWNGRRERMSSYDQWYFEDMLSEACELARSTDSNARCESRELLESRVHQLRQAR